MNMQTNGSNANGFYATEYKNSLSLGNRVLRTIWASVWLTFFRLSPPPFFWWRRFLLRCFGAKMDSSARVYPSARIWAPWMLTMEARSCLGPESYCYDVAPVFLGVDATVSFRGFLCTASHDIRHPERPLVTGPIRLEKGAYVFADAFIGMNVTLGEGAVAAARAVVVKSVEPYAIVGGNPAVVIGTRDMKAVAGPR